MSRFSIRFNGYITPGGISYEVPHSRRITKPCSTEPGRLVKFSKTQRARYYTVLIIDHTTPFRLLCKLTAINKHKGCQGRVCNSKSSHRNDGHCVNKHVHFEFPREPSASALFETNFMSTRNIFFTELQAWSPKEHNFWFLYNWLLKICI